MSVLRTAISSLGIAAVAMSYAAGRSVTFQWMGPEISYSSAIVGGNATRMFGSFFISGNPSNEFEGTKQLTAVWHGSDVPTPLFQLNSPAYRGRINDVSDMWQVGEIRDFYANDGLERPVLWSSLPGSTQYLDLGGYDRGMAYGTDGMRIVGAASFVEWLEFGPDYRIAIPLPTRAVTWGSDGILRRLNSDGAESALARGVQGLTVVGSISDADGHSDATVWTLSPQPSDDQVVTSTLQVITPANAAYAEAVGIRGGVIVGRAGFPAGASAQPHAVLWRGPGWTFTDLHPNRFDWSSANWTDGEFQTGWVSMTTEESPTSFLVRAALWRGTKASYTDVHALIPVPVEESIATCVIRDGEDMIVAGTARVLNGYWRAFKLVLPGTKRAPAAPPRPPRR